LFLGYICPACHKTGVVPHGDDYNQSMTAQITPLQLNSAAAVVEEPPQPGGALFVLWSLFWLLMILIALQDSMQRSGLQWWEPLLWEGSSGLFATFWLFMQRRADRRYAAHLDAPLTWFWHHLKWLPLVAVTFIVAVYGFRHVVYAALGETYEHESWTFVLAYETVKIALFFGLWLGIIFGFHSYAQWRTQQQRLLALQRALAESQLAQLKAQLRPHFLFNALNTVSALMHVDVTRADRLLARLGDLLRASLQAGEQDVTSLREELRLLDLYCQIMQERFADRVTVIRRVAEDALDAAVPMLLLQPLLENAFKHGVERTSGAVQIEISAERKAAQLLMVVRNTGGLAAEARPGGVGLRNCRERLHVMFGDEARLELLHTGADVEARVSIPWREHAA
jgi:two-component system, LytTR family, sensor kinase